jgi:hypothetical protein
MNVKHETSFWYPGALAQPTTYTNVSTNNKKREKNNNVIKANKKYTQNGKKSQKRNYFEKKGEKLTKFGNESSKFTIPRPTPKKLGEKKTNPTKPRCKTTCKAK